VNITFRPREGGAWPGELTRSRAASPFKESDRDTEKLLVYEVGRLDGKMLVVQLAIQEMDLRVDGRPKLRAEYKHPGVIVSFESKHGPLRYFTDVFNHWNANLRAIALGLEALRKVDRYGISRRGEQYTGWLQLEGSEAAGEISTREGAARFILEHVPDPKATVAVLLRDLAEGYTDSLIGAYRAAAKTLHPDASGTGDPELFKKLQEARDLLLRKES
jgi:hypothetical protein